MIVHAFYDEDPRVRRQAESLVARGRPVDVFALRRRGDEPEGIVAGVRVHRLGVERHQGAGIRVYLAEYLAFFFKSAWAVTRAQRRRHYALLEVHSPPDFLVLAGLWLRLTGVPVLLDCHEVVPELFRARFPGLGNRLMRRILAAEERLSLAFAHAALTVSGALRERLIELGVPPRKLTVVPNAPALGRFDPADHRPRAFMADGRLRLVYAGALTPNYELGVALAAVARIVARRPELETVFDIHGRGDTEPELRAAAATLGLGEHVRFHGRTSIEAVPAVLAAADIGLAVTRRNEHTELAIPTKIFEYAAMGLPVAATRLPLAEAAFPPGTVAWYETGDADGLADAVLRLVDDPAAREAAAAANLAHVRAGAWEVVAERYVALVEGLIADGLSSTRAGDGERAPRPGPEEA